MILEITPWKCEVEYTWTNILQLFINQSYNRVEVQKKKYWKIFYLSHMFQKIWTFWQFTFSISSLSICLFAYVFLFASV